MLVLGGAAASGICQNCPNSFCETPKFPFSGMFPLVGNPCFNFKRHGLRFCAVGCTAVVIGASYTVHNARPDGMSQRSHSHGEIHAISAATGSQREVQNCQVSRVVLVCCLFIMLATSSLRNIECCCRSKPTDFHCWSRGYPACKKTEWWGAGMVICLEQGANLHMAQLMPLPLTVSCFSKILIGCTCLVPAHPGSPGQRPLNRLVFPVTNAVMSATVLSVD